MHLLSVGLMFQSIFGNVALDNLQWRTKDNNYCHNTNVQAIVEKPTQPIIIFEFIIKTADGAA